MPPFQYPEAATPCPSNWKHSKSPFSSFDIHDDGNDTAALEFTTDIGSVLQQNPRRVKRAATFKIHEDPTAAKASGLPTATWRKITTGTTGSSMFSQPAQRLPGKRVSFAPSQIHGGNKGATKDDREPKAPSNEPMTEQIKDAQMKKKDPLKKDRRRNTIYIPSDDTTVPTMFMSIFSPLKTDLSEVSEVGRLEAQIAKKYGQRRRQSTVSDRVPLEHKPRVEQETAIAYDIAGSNTGKENVPPGALFCNQETCKTASDIEFKPPSTTPVKKLPHMLPDENAKSRPSNTRRSIGKQSTVLQPSCPNSPRTCRSNVAANKSVAKVQPGNRCEAKAKLTNTTVKRSPKDPVITAKPSPKQTVKRKSPTRLIVPRISNLEMYPVLSEDITNPQMYEENWLAHQEIAITQLVNSIFDAARGVAVPPDADTLRHEVLDYYQDAYFSLLHKRVQASLLYGALRVPKEVLRRGGRLKDDIGMRRKFLVLWLTTYDLSALRSAAETVVGRRIPVQTDSPDSTKGRSEKMLRRSMEAFLDTFLVRNEDVDSSSKAVKAEDGGAEGSSYCRTLLRSIMIILLLDKGRMTSGTSLPRCLFVPSSKYKSSAAVLQALGQLLLPSVGDISRPLSHLDIQVEYEQHRLQEYEYRIKNLAVDLRDGILLTRLVELLLFSGPDCGDDNENIESTATITIPTGQVLTVSQEETDWPLSQHLKMPCTSRATKLFNVQVALSSLAEVRDMGMFVKDIRPEDIVDGYREKTIALLWALVGKLGLPALVDGSDLRREIVRLRKKTGRLVQQTDFETAVDCESGREILLLKEWATTLAQLKGIMLENLTTSFADGKIFESIVDEYEALISPEMGENESTETDGRSKRAKAPLAARLRRLGCSSQFGKFSFQCKMFVNWPLTDF